VLIGAAGSGDASAAFTDTGFVTSSGSGAIQTPTQTIAIVVVVAGIRAIELGIDEHLVDPVGIHLVDQI
jgi:hypothetical protein